MKIIPMTLSIKDRNKSVPNLISHFTSADFILTLYRLYTDFIPTLYRLYTDFIPTLYQLHTDFILTLYRLYTDFILYTSTPIIIILPHVSTHQSLTGKSNTK